jgi:hypothetical protein
MDHAPVAEFQTVASTPLSCRPGDRDALSLGAPSGHRSEPSSDVRRIAGSEMLAEKGRIAAPIHWSTNSVVISSKAAPTDIL